MIENFVERIPESFKSKPGHPFYSGRSAFSEPSDLYTLGIHPGGDGGPSIREHIEHVLQRQPADWSDYRDMRWDGAEPGQRPLQRNMLHLLKETGKEPHKVPSSQAVFLNALDADAFKRKYGRAYEELADECWPFHKAVIDELGVKVVAVYGKRSADYVRQKLNARERVNEFNAFFGENRSKARTAQTYRTDDGKLTVVTLWLPGRGHPWWTNPDSDPTHMVVNALKGR